jgi:hypothetical protein
MRGGVKTHKSTMLAAWAPGGDANHLAALHLGIEYLSRVGCTKSQYLSREQSNHSLCHVLCDLSCSANTHPKLNI